MDHGFSEVISRSKVFELQEKFFQLPFQASKCKLAGDDRLPLPLRFFSDPSRICVFFFLRIQGLEPFCQEPEVLKKFEAIASGRILLAEILERGPVPLAVLYDTSQDDDLNINAACMKSLQDKTLSSPLQVTEKTKQNDRAMLRAAPSPGGSPQVNSAYMNVTISSVCSDGTIYCQLPSRGLAKLNDILEKIETYFHSQVCVNVVCLEGIIYFCGVKWWVSTCVTAHYYHLLFRRINDTVSFF